MIGPVTLEIMEDMKNYFSNRVKFGSIFNDDDPKDSIENILEKYQQLENDFVDFNSLASTVLDSTSNGIITGRKGTGKTSYITKSFFNHIYHFKELNRYIPIFIDSNLLVYDEELKDYNRIIEDFYAGIKFQIIKSIVLFISAIKKTIINPITRKRISQIENELLEFKVDISQFEDDQIDFTSDNVDNESYVKFIESYRKKINEKIRRDQIALNFNTLIDFLNDIKDTWHIRGFKIYIDEISEFFLYRGYYKKQIKDIFLEFLSKIATYPQYKGQIIIKLVFYKKSDFFSLQEKSTTPVDIKYFPDQICLDSFDESKYFGEKIGTVGEKIKTRYQKDLNSIIDQILLKSTPNWKGIFDLSNDNEELFYQLLRESTAGVMRELGIIFTTLMKRAIKDGTISKISIANLRVAILDQYNNHKDKSEIKNERELFQKIINFKKNTKLG